jgi:hypothetical protein
VGAGLKTAVAWARVAVFSAAVLTAGVCGGIDALIERADARLTRVWRSRW